MQAYEQEEADSAAEAAADIVDEEREAKLDEIEPETFIEHKASDYVKSLSEKEKRKEISDGIKIVVILILSLFSLAVILIALDFLLIPLMLSWFLVYLIKPLVNILIGKSKWPLIKKKTYLPRWSAVTIALVVILSLFICIGLIITQSIEEVIEKSDLYAQKLDSLYSEVMSLAADFGYSSSDLDSAIPSLNVSSIAITVVSYLFSFLRSALLVFLFTITMLLTYDENEIKSTLEQRIDHQVRAYLLVKVAFATMSGVILAICFFSVGAPFAFVFALLTFLLNFIPNIGSIISYALPIPVLLLDPTLELWRAAVAIGIPIATDMVLSNFLEPKMMGKQMDIPAISVMISLMFWGSVWGIVGAILSLPITTTIITYFENIDHPIATMMINIFMGDFGKMDPSKRHGIQSEASL
eukprot:TRINITY_DN5108_c0_g1_i1.p1 TRINITY_DN5108_c0_g1~~TRINITY_DN5108_c0_g1_i1.p1  ORF type:complete len:412 (-),score=93.31 TRINITY_DN5108_c0_g1_i1:100-1335(-)